MDPRLAYARELEQRDAEVAARIEHVLSLERRANELRGRAEAVEVELTRLLERRGRVATAAAQAERALAAEREALAAAHGQAGGSEEVSTSDSRGLAHAEIDVGAAEERRTRLVARVVALERDDERLRGEVSDLGGIAARLAAELERESRIVSAATPVAEVPALQEWASRAYAALLVARSGLESERDRIVREANELASAVLGEALQATSASTVRGRLERVLA